MMSVIKSNSTLNKLKNEPTCTNGMNIGSHSEMNAESSNLMCKIRY